MTNLMTAHNQWCYRPADESYWGIPDMLAAAKVLHNNSTTETVAKDSLTAISHDGEIGIVTSAGFTRTNNWSFGTLAQRASAPPEYLRTLPADMAVNCLNYGLSIAPGDSQALISTADGVPTLRALTSEKYGRVWYDETLETLQALTDGTGWRVPPARPRNNDPRARPATIEDVTRPGVHGLSVSVGDMIAPAGAYLSDRDMFLFMVDESREIVPGMFRGFFLSNSEVKARAFELVTFLYQSVCGNHICWGADGVQKFSIKHLGAKGKDIASATVTARALTGGRKFLSEYNNEATGETARLLSRSMEYELGKNPEECLETAEKFVLSKRLLIPKKTLESGFEVAAEGRYGNPRSVFSLVSGLTQIARDLQYTDARTNLSVAASKIIDIVR